MFLPYCVWEHSGRYPIDTGRVMNDSVQNGNASDEARKAEEKEEPTQLVFLNRLKEYKEFIAIVLFFLAGFLWIYGYFATKEQLSEVRCLMDANITLLSGQVQSNVLAQQLLKNKEMQLTIIDESKTNLIAQQRLLDLQQGEKRLERQIFKETEQVSVALAKLRSANCHQ